MHESGEAVSVVLIGIEHSEPTRLYGLQFLIAPSLEIFILVWWLLFGTTAVVVFTVTVRTYLWTRNSCPQENGSGNVGLSETV